MNIIVAHPFQQHSFKTAYAVKKQGCLFKYLTTVYLKSGTLTHLVSKVLKGDNLKRTLGRRTELLNDSDVRVMAEWSNLLLLLLQRIDKKGTLYKWWYWKTIEIFNNKLYKYVVKNDVDMVIVYDTVSADFIKKIKKRKPNVKILLDMSAPNANYMKYNFDKEKENTELYKNVSLDGLEDSRIIKANNYAKFELANADGFLAASDFTAKSLEWEGIPSDRIHKCTYGVASVESTSYMGFKNPEKIICVYLGAVTLQKGAFRLFEAIKKLKRKDMEFHFYGHYDADSQYCSEFENTCVFHGHIPHDAMLNELKKSDIIIFPSFSDGFGFSVTEALATNNIAVCSVNAGVSELVINGVNGYRFNPEKHEELSDILEGIERNTLREMQKNAPDSIKEYTWDRYNIQLQNAIKLTELN